MTDEPKRKPGRPSTGKRGNFTFRVTADLRSKLETEASRTQRPVSEVIEERLTISFHEDNILAKIERRMWPLMWSPARFTATGDGYPAQAQISAPVVFDEHLHEGDAD